MSSTMDYPSWPAPTAHIPRPVTLFPTYQPSPPVSPTQFPRQPYPQRPHPPQPPQLPPLPLPSSPLQKKAKRARRARTLTTASHALTLFTALGIPASSPLWLEYYFTTQYPRTALMLLGSVFGVQIGGLWVGYVGGRYLYAITRNRSWEGRGKAKGKAKDRTNRAMIRGSRRAIPLLTALLTTTSLAVLAILAASPPHPTPQPGARSPKIVVWMLILLQGGTVGPALGVCAAVSMGVLREHFGRGAGAMCHCAGWAGACVYSTLVWVFLGKGQVSAAYGVECGVGLVTLGAAAVLARTREGGSEGEGEETSTILLARRGSQQHYRTVRVMITLIVPLLVIPAFFVPLLLLSAQASGSPDVGFYTIVTLYAGAAVSSCLVPHMPSLDLGHDTLLAACLAIAALATVPLIWDRGMGVVIGWALVYGAAVGGVGALSTEEEDERRGLNDILIASVGLGVGVGGVVGFAVLLQNLEKGMETVLGSVVGLLGLSAVGVGVLVVKDHAA